ncbi:MAG: hypothetical protein ACOX81_07905 [Candidatus Heteroscillospira sp.]|jgi:hypothetical protein
MENDVLEMLESLYAMVSEAWGVPLGNDKCIVEREKVLGALDEIKTKLPVELAEAKRLVSAKEEFIGNAKREAESIRKLAEERARHMVEEQEIMREARSKSAAVLAEAEEKSSAMLDSAQRRSAELRRVAWEYVDSSLRETEEAVNTALGAISGVRSKFAALSAPENIPVPAPEPDAPVLTDADIPEELRDAEDIPEN